MNYIQLNFQIHWHTKNRPYLGNYNRQRGAVTCKMFVAKKYLNNLFCAKALTLIVFELFYDKAPRQPPTPPPHPKKSCFFEKMAYFGQFFIRKRSFSNMLLRIIIGNSWRKLGEKILIPSIFGFFPSTKMALSQPLLGR